MFALCGNKARRKKKRATDISFSHKRMVGARARHTRANNVSAMASEIKTMTIITRSDARSASLCASRPHVGAYSAMKHHVLARMFRQA